MTTKSEWFSMDTQHAAGTGVGMTVGLFKAFMGLQMFGMLTWGLALDTAILAFLGGMLGWIATEMMKIIKAEVRRLVQNFKDKRNAKA